MTIMPATRDTGRNSAATFAMVLFALAVSSCSDTVVPKPVATLTISPVSTSIIVNRTQTFTVTAIDAAGDTLTGRTTTWTVTPTTVASVSATGVVTGVAVGTASVTVTSEGKTATAGVTVTSGVTGIALSALPSSLVVGAVQQLTATVQSAMGISQDVTWQSSNPAVATVVPASGVGAGTVTCLAAGTTTITARAVADTTQRATVALTVIPPPVATVTVSAASLSLSIGVTQQLSAVTADAAGNVLTGRTIAWTTSNLAVATVSATGLVTAVGAGSATLSATSEGKVGTSAISVTSVGFNMAVTSFTLTQVVQRPDNTVSMIAGNAALVSVYATANQALPPGAVPRVRIRVFKGVQTLVDDTRAVTGTIGGTPVATAPTHQLLVAGSIIQPGISVLAEINPTGTGEIAEIGHADNVYPASSVPLPIDVRAMATLSIRFVPLFLSTNAATATVPTGIIESKYLATVRQIHPVNTITTTVGSTFTVADDFAGGSVTFWTSALSQLDAKRVADGGTAHDYGVVPLPSGTHNVSTGGFSYIPTVGASSARSTRTAMGMDATPNWSDPLFGTHTMAHELGHNMGRRHAPCGGATNLDPNYPYPGAVIGVVGWDVYSMANGLSTTAALKNPAVDTDIMSYCYDWVSDYTYQGMIDFRSGVADGIGETAQSTQALLVSGTANGAGVILNPSYLIDTRPVLPDGLGQYMIEGLDAAGRSLFRYSFTPKEIDHAPGETHFTFAIPVSDATRDALVSVRATGPQGSQTRMSAMGRAALLAWIAGTARGALAPPSVQRVASNRVRLAWDAGLWKGVMVRDADTHEVLAFGRGGDMVVQTTKRAVILVLSDGVQSATQVVAVP